MLYVILGIIIIVVTLSIIILINCLKLKELNTTIEICDTNIIEVLKNKQKMLDKLVRDSKQKKLINDLKVDDNIKIFDYEQVLFDVKWNLFKIINEEKYKPENDMSKIVKDLNDLEDSLEGLKDYYNSKSIIYNELYYKKPFSLVYHLLKLEPKHKFKLRSMEELEILKN